MFSNIQLKYTPKAENLQLYIRDWGQSNLEQSCFEGLAFFFCCSRADNVVKIKR